MQESSTPRTSSTVVAHTPHLRELPYYTVPDDGLEMGASLGNNAVWVTTKGTGAIDRVFAVELGQSLFNAIFVRYAGPGYRLHSDVEADSATGSTPDTSMGGVPAGAPTGASGNSVPRPSFVGLRPDTPGTFELHPAYQRHHFTIAGYIEVKETVFVPLTCDCLVAGDPPAVYQTVELTNTGTFAQNIRVFGYARLRGTLPDDVQARYDADLHALVASNRSRPEAARVFGLRETPEAYATSFDFGAVYDPLHVRALQSSTEASGDILGCLQIDVHLEAGETRALTFLAAVSGGGEDKAITAYRAALDTKDPLADTLTYLDTILTRAQVLTPDPVINQGALWSKVNMLRVMERYPQGPAFTNEPGVSSNVVGRDAAWFVYGNDHFMPEFSRVLLDTFARVQYANGKLPEYYSAIDGRVEDDNLNINDDTPLYVLAVNHHFRATGDRDWLRRIYPSVTRAARYIISQEDDRSLVFCTAKDPRGNVWASASWRNIIPNYSINGAVTEINAECVAALRAAGHLAQNLGQPDAEAQEFFAAAEALRAAMDKYLLNPANGLYYLNLDADGNAHTDVTGDQIFPVMFRVCDDDTGFRIISRLNSPDFWTEAGLRTASRYDPLYDPAAYVGLIGGVWPGLTWWYAFAAARYHPSFMVRALRSSFEHYAANPKTNNTVPGQFSEWFDGESLVNRGMRLSPWEPPRFLWAAVEGVCGLMLTPDLPSVNPLVPGDWKWVALRRLPYHGQELTYFAARNAQAPGFYIYANCDMETAHHKDIYDEDISERVYAFAASAEVVAFRRKNELAILVGNVGTQTSVVPVNLQEVIDPAKDYTLRVYNSERGDWESAKHQKGSAFAALAVSIESNGYRIITVVSN